MTEYAILLPDNETQWEQADESTRRTTYARHRRFMELLAERGHQLTGGAELTHSRTGTVVRGTLDEVTVTEGPYAESVEQLSGFYLIRSDDLADLQQLSGLLAGDGAVEIRAVVPDSDPVLDAGRAADPSVGAGAGAALGVVHGADSAGNRSS